MIRALIKDSINISLLLAFLFVLGILYSAYQLYSLPGKLMLSSGYHQQLTPIYVALATTFLLGLLAFLIALKAKRERIVFRWKQEEKDTSRNLNQESDRKNISLNNIKASLEAPGQTTNHFLTSLCKELEACQGALYEIVEENTAEILRFKEGYAMTHSPEDIGEYESGDGFVGQVMVDKKPLYIDEVPEGYINIVSGLGNARPQYLFIVPVISEGVILGIIELAFFKKLTEEEKNFVEEANALLAKKLIANQTT